MYIHSKSRIPIQKAGYFSILVDETKDLSKHEQLAIVVHYIDVYSAVVHEQFLSYIEPISLNAQSLSKYILDTLKLFYLDSKIIVSQGYDGTLVMSGHGSDVQQGIR